MSKDEMDRNTHVHVLWEREEERDGIRKQLAGQKWLTGEVERGRG
jgi:hypothetical protein